MRFRHKDIKNAVSNLDNITKGISGNLYIMLKFKEDSVSFCYSDGRVSYIESVYVMEEFRNDAQDKECQAVVIEFNGFKKKLELYDASGVFIDYIDMSVNMEKSSLELDSRKYFLQKMSEIDGKPCEPYEEKIYGSRIRTSYVCSKIESSSKFNMTTRTDYDEIFELQDNKSALIDHPLAEKTIGAWINLDKAKFIADIKKVTSTDGAPVGLLVTDKKAVIAIGTGYTSVIYAGDNLVYGCMSTKHLRMLTEIINRFDSSEELKAASDGKYIKFITGNERVGIRVEQTKTNLQALTSLVKFESIDYSNEYLAFNKAILQDMIRGALTVKGKESVTDLLIVLRENNVAIRAFNRSTGSSEESLEVYARDVKAKDDDLINYNDKHLRVSLQNLSNILRNCSGDVVYFNFGHDTDEDEDNGSIASYLRISDVVGNVAKGMFYLCI